ncbi:tetratricopeptide repeat protein [Tsuneonella sp. YG55]|uniref:Tetratricopeptide repeat protein n=1 Tax=Tsuneonella litorea TaxID=2976475 RepID=A0A9X2W0L7_9SPHN|nr:tetratricopeptide repeat protein [Tsuneonella litorea]MCT2558329.1 tetratricopeptide repeat protein [Tsuneonella litorea]
MRLYRAAVEESPRFADAWSGLALAHVRSLYRAPDERSDAVAAEAREAAGRAIAIDANNARAQAALVMVEPEFQHWDARIAALEEISARTPGTWEITLSIGLLHQATGDFRQALPVFEKLLLDEPANLRLHRILARTYFRTGRPAQAGRLLDIARKHWPRDYGLWNAGLDFLMLQGRYDEARRYLADDSLYPFNVASDALPKRHLLLDVLEGREPGQRDRLIRSFLGHLALKQDAYPGVIRMMGLLGAKTRMVEVMRGYYFGEGRYARSLSRHSPRLTGFLYQPHVDGQRSEPQFGAMMARIGIPPRPRF